MPSTATAEKTTLFLTNAPAIGRKAAGAKVRNQPGTYQPPTPLSQKTPSICTSTPTVQANQSAVSQCGTLRSRIIRTVASAIAGPAVSSGATGARPAK